MFDESLLKKIIEGALFAATGPMSIEKLALLFGDDERPDSDTFKRLLVELQQDYHGRGVALQEVASGYRFQVVQETAGWVSRLWDEKPARYSRALLETLALIAYRQPITRGEIEEIRGVSTSSQIVKTLLEREWVRVVGYRDVPGRPAMYATTKQFMDYFNLQSLEELPPLSEIRDLDQINAELELTEAARSPAVVSTSLSVNDESVDNGAVGEDPIEEGLVEESTDNPELDLETPDQAPPLH